MAQADGLRAQKKRETRRALEQAALELVNERGYEHTTVDDICAQAGVSRMTFFNYFPSKLGAILGYATEPPSVDDVVQHLEEHPSDCYLDALADVLEGLRSAQADPALQHLRKETIHKDSSLLLKEQQGNFQTNRTLAEALRTHLTKHPEARMITNVSVLEEGFMGASFALYLMRCASFHHVFAQDEATPRDIRRYVAAYTQMGSDANAGEAGA